MCTPTTSMPTIWRGPVAALWRGWPQRIYNVNDDTQLKMGDYFDLAADLYGLPRPPACASQRAAMAKTLLPMLLSFMSLNPAAWTTPG
jgi:hypothetical protein